MFFKGSRYETVETATLTDAFDYERGPIDLQNHDARSEDGYDVKFLTFPSYGENGQDGNLVTARYYRSQSEGRKPLVIILPIWGSKHTYPANKMAKFLRSRYRGEAHVLLHLGPDRLVDPQRVVEARSHPHVAEAVRWWGVRFGGRSDAAHRVVVGHEGERTGLHDRVGRQLLDHPHPRPGA